MGFAPTPVAAAAAGLLPAATGGDVMDAALRWAWTTAVVQGLTLVHFSTQLRRFLWDRGCIYGVFWGCLGGVRGYQGVFRVCFCARNGSG